MKNIKPEKIIDGIIIPYHYISFAIKAHADTNHTYGKMKYPYSFHLALAVSCGYRFIEYIPVNDRDIVIGAIWNHDVIEDARITFNDLLEATNKDIANIVYAVSNEKGKDRSERANDKYYKGIINTPYASFVKLADRLANIQYSRETNSDMFVKYIKEHREFTSHFIKCKEPWVKPMIEALNMNHLIKTH